MKFAGTYWRSITVVLTPIIFLPIMLANENEDRIKALRCLYIVCVMTIYWVTEAIPLPITGMIPMVAFPLMNILDTDRVCMMYMKETMVMFIGGLVLAQVSFFWRFIGVHTLFEWMKGQRYVQKLSDLFLSRTFSPHDDCFVVFLHENRLI